MTKETDWDYPVITLDNLQQFTYCPRLAYMMYVDGRWMENAYTLEGKQIHSRVDKVDQVLPDVLENIYHKDESGELIDDAPPQIARSVSLWSGKLGINGKLDLVSTYRNHAVPVETKRGKVPQNAEHSWPDQRIQLMAQGLLLRENGYKCDHGILYFAGSKTRVNIPFDKFLENQTREMITRACQLQQRSLSPPPLQNSPKCNGCSLAEICLPDETRLLYQNKGKAVSVYDKESTDVLVRKFFPNRDEKLPLYIQEQGAFVGKKNKVLKIYKSRELLNSIRIADISQLVLCGNVSISAQTIHLLCQEEIPIVHLSMGHWFYGCTQGIGLRNAYLREKQFQRASQSNSVLELARSIVSSKIENQRTLLRRNGCEVPKKVLNGMKQAMTNAREAETTESLLGVEGYAAKIYFQEFSTMIKIPEFSDWDFNSRNRRPPKDPVNAMLSFGYALLTKETTIALLAEGFDPYWGFYHKPRFGRPSLALDLMEEFRPIIVDSAVITAINTTMIKRNHFIQTEAGCVMKPSSRKNLIKAYENRMDQLIIHPVFDYKCSWRRIIRLQAQLLARYIRGEINQYTPIKTR